MTFSAVVIHVGTAFQFFVTVHALVVKSAFPVQHEIFTLFLMTLGAWSMVTCVIFHVAHLMAWRASFQAVLEHVVMAGDAAVMGCVAYAWNVFCPGIGVAVAAFLGFLLYVCRVMAGKAIVFGIFLVCLVIEAESAQFCMVAFYAVAVVRKGVDVFANVIAVKSLGMAGAAGQWRLGFSLLFVVAFAAGNIVVAVMAQVGENNFSTAVAEKYAYRYFLFLFRYHISGNSQSHQNCDNYGDGDKFSVHRLSLFYKES